MIAICHFLALEISRPCLVKLGSRILFSLAKILYMADLFFQRYKKRLCYLQSLFGFKTLIGLFDLQNQVFVFSFFNI